MSELAASLPNTEGAAQLIRYVAYGAAVLTTAGILAGSCDNSGGGDGGRPEGGWGVEQEAKEWGSRAWREPPEGFYRMGGSALAAVVAAHEAIQATMDDQ